MTRKLSKVESRRMTEEAMKNGLDTDPLLPLPKEKPTAKKKASQSSKRKE